MSILDIQTVNLGIYANDSTGDDLRTAFFKTNTNFTSIDASVVLDGASLGNGAPVFSNKLGNNLQFRSLESFNDNLSINYDSNKISLNVVDSINAVFEDPNPILGGILNLNNHDIIGFGNININGTIKSPLFTGNLNGDVTGTVSDIGNHVISGLSDVSAELPTVGQALHWTGVFWAPGNLELNNLTNVQISNPIATQVLQYNGSNWVNATVVTPPVDNIQNFDFGVLGQNITNPTELLLQAMTIDFNNEYALDLQ
jgi:hypothetical protein